jgi:hypothetical protein
MSATARKILATLNRIMSPTTDAAESSIDLELPFGTTVDITTTRRKRLATTTGTTTATQTQKKQEFLKAERPESEEFEMEPPPSDALVTPPTEQKQNKFYYLTDASRPSSELVAKTEMKAKTQGSSSVKVKQETKPRQSDSSKQKFESFGEEEEGPSITSGLGRKRKKSKSKSKSKLKSKSKSELKRERDIQTTAQKISNCIVNHHFLLFLYISPSNSNNKLLFGFSQIKNKLKTKSQKMSLKLIPMMVPNLSIPRKKKQRNYSHNERNLKLLQILKLIWAVTKPLLKVLPPRHPS